MIMKKELQEHLLNLHDSGYEIRISSIYVSGMVNEIRRVEETGIIVYSDDVFSDRPLSDVTASEVSVYSPIDNWEDLSL